MARGAGNTFSIRLSDDLRARLQRAANENGQSLNNEIRSRLERSFDADQKISDRFDGFRDYAFFRLLHLIGTVGWEGKNEEQQHWLDDPYRYAQKSAAIRMILAALAPGGGVQQKENKAHPAAHALATVSVILKRVKDLDWLRNALQAIKQEMSEMTLKAIDEFDMTDAFFDMSVEIGIHRTLAGVLERAPENLAVLPDVRAEFERTES